MLTIYNEELTKRKEFQSMFKDHLLTLLFSGMEDELPSYATKAPSIFDCNLPKITEDDMNDLKKILPELFEKMNLPDMCETLKFFTIKEDFEKTDDTVIDQKLVDIEGGIDLIRNEQNELKPTNSEICLVAPRLPHFKDLDK